jgi:hypothetical protein
MMKPEQPFLGFSVTSVAGIIRGIRTPFWLDEKKNLDSCKLERSLCLDAEELDISAVGLNLEDLTLMTNN